MSVHPALFEIYEDCMGKSVILYQYKRVALFIRCVFINKRKTVLFSLSQVCRAV